MAGAGVYLLASDVAFDSSICGTAEEYGDARLERCRAFLRVPGVMQTVQRPEFWSAIVALQAYWPCHLGIDNLLLVGRAVSCCDAEADPPGPDCLSDRRDSPVASHGVQCPVVQGVLVVDIPVVVQRPILIVLPVWMTIETPLCSTFRGGRCLCCAGLQVRVPSWMKQSRPHRCSR